MALTTPHMFIGVLLINFIFVLGTGMMANYDNIELNGTNDAKQMLTILSGTQEGIERNLLSTDRDGVINYQGMIREDAGDGAQYSEATINLGQNLTFMSGLAIGTLLPITTVKNMATNALNTSNLLIGIAYAIIGMILVGINLQLYLRVFNIIYSKYLG